jgi:ATP synthase protein I
MSNNTVGNEKSSSAESDKIAAQIGAKAKRKMHARHRGNSGVWLGLGMMGLIGWSIVVPTLLGAAIGIWLDVHHPSQHSWTLALLMAGLTLGCFNAWHWVDKEDRAMRAEQEPEQKQEQENDDESKPQ